MPSFDNIIPLKEWGIFSVFEPCVIAGPCSAESSSVLEETSSSLSSQGISVIRAGLWKPRTHPGCYEGPGAKGLEWLCSLRSQGFKVCTEVAGAKHVEACLEAGVDMLWIGARTTSNPFLVQEIADALRGSDLPVLVKNPLNPDMELWEGALERLYIAGARKLGAVHRGFSTGEATRYRNNPCWSLVVKMRTLHPELPFFCDPSHMAGYGEFVPELISKAMSLGFDGLMVESHANPAEALSDARQQIEPEQLGQIIRDSVRNKTFSSDALAALRLKMDETDARIISDLAERMSISREIGLLKKEGKMPVIQAERWEKVLDGALQKAHNEGLDESLVEKIYMLLHEYSVALQDKLVSGK